ncbi:MAG: hypothetical protein V1882_06410 [Candidatus Omnitrophota bacterium]
MMKKIMKQMLALVVAVVMVTAFSCPVFAEVADINTLIEKMNRLELENKQLRTELDTVKIKVSSIQSVEKPGTKTISAPLPANSITSKPPVSFYGFIKGDAIYNDSTISSLGSTSQRLGTNNKKNETILSAKDTRLGLDINGPEILGGGKTVGKFEMDFWGGWGAWAATAASSAAINDGSNSPLMRMRLAYVDLVYENWDVLMGQNWDFFSPLNPSTLNFDVMWRQGNLGDRHPQLTGTRVFKDVLNGTVKVKGGVLSSSMTQISTGLPVFAGYVDYDSKWRDIPVYFGVGSLFGKERANEITSSIERSIWGITGSYKISPIKGVTVSGEGYLGQNLANFRGGSPTSMILRPNGTVSSIRSNGGWSQVAWRPICYKKLELAGGLGADNLNTDGIATTTGVWDYNMTYFSNIKYDLGDNVTVGLEYQRFGTKYEQQAGGNGNRVQSSLIYKF